MADEDEMVAIDVVIDDEMAAEMAALMENEDPPVKKGKKHNTKKGNKKNQDALSGQSCGDTDDNVNIIKEQDDKSMDTNDSDLKNFETQDDTEIQSDGLNPTDNYNLTEKESVPANAITSTSTFDDASKNEDTNNPVNNMENISEHPFSEHNEDENSSANNMEEIQRHPFSQYDENEDSSANNVEEIQKHPFSQYEDENSAVNDLEETPKHPFSEYNENLEAPSKHPFSQCNEEEDVMSSNIEKSDPEGLITPTDNDGLSKEIDSQIDDNYPKISTDVPETSQMSNNESFQILDSVVSSKADIRTTAENEGADDDFLKNFVGMDDDEDLDSEQITVNEDKCLQQNRLPEDKPGFQENIKSSPHSSQITKPNEKQTPSNTYKPKRNNTPNTGTAVFGLAAFLNNYKKDPSNTIRVKEPDPTECTRNFNSSFNRNTRDRFNRSETSNQNDRYNRNSDERYNRSDASHQDNRYNRNTDDGFNRSENTDRYNRNSEERYKKQESSTFNEQYNKKSEERYNRSESSLSNDRFSRDTTDEPINQVETPNLFDKSLENISKSTEPSSNNKTNITDKPHGGENRNAFLEQMISGTWSNFKPIKRPDPPKKRPQTPPYPEPPEKNKRRFTRFSSPDKPEIPFNQPDETNEDASSRNKFERNKGNQGRSRDSRSRSKNPEPDDTGRRKRGDSSDLTEEELVVYRQIEAIRRIPRYVYIGEFDTDRKFMMDEEDKACIILGNYVRVKRDSVGQIVYICELCEILISKKKNMEEHGKDRKHSNLKAAADRVKRKTVLEDARTPPPPPEPKTGDLDDDIDTLDDVMNELMASVIDTDQDYNLACGVVCSLLSNMADYDKQRKHKRNFKNLSESLNVCLKIKDESLSIMNKDMLDSRLINPLSSTGIANIPPGNNPNINNNNAPPMRGNPNVNQNRGNANRGNPIMPPSMNNPNMPLSMNTPNMPPTMNNPNMPPNMSNPIMPPNMSNPSIPPNMANPNITNPTMAPNMNMYPQYGYQAPYYMQGANYAQNMPLNFNPQYQS